MHIFVCSSEHMCTSKKKKILWALELLVFLPYEHLIHILLRKKQSL